MLRRPPSRKDKRAAYNRAHRARVKAGRGTAIVEYGPETIDVLVRGHYLPADREAFTRAEIGEALSRMVASVRELRRVLINRMRRRGSVNVRFAPKATEVPRRRN
jgi:hypothetical protein